MSEQVAIQSILDALPHRYPFLLVDRVMSYEPHENLVAIKNVTINEPFFNGHFPGNPIMPGVLIVEALAQAGGVLHSLSNTPSEGHEFIYYFAGVDNVKFKHMVTPGDQLRLEVRSISRKSSFWKIGGEAYVDDKLACSAVLMTAVKEVEK